MSSYILIVEDDAKIADMVVNYLHASGYATQVVGDGVQAVKQALQHPPALVLLDVMLPGLDGVAVCKQVRAFSTVPIIMVTARVQELDRLLGLESGADDYLCKPFSPRELVARVKALLRRASLASPASGAAPVQDDFRVDAATQRVFCQSQPVPLTTVEYRLFAKLHGSAGQVLSRQQLIDACFDDFRDTSDRTVDSHIKNLRKKLDAVHPAGSGIASVYGVGYRFEAPV